MRLREEKPPSMHSSYCLSWHWHLARGQMRARQIMCGASHKLGLEVAYQFSSHSMARTQQCGHIGCRRAGPFSLALLLTSKELCFWCTTCGLCHIASLVSLSVIPCRDGETQRSNGERMFVCGKNTHPLLQDTQTAFTLKLHLPHGAGLLMTSRTPNSGPCMDLDTAWTHSFLLIANLYPDHFLDLNSRICFSNGFSPNLKPKSGPFICFLR